MCAASLFACGATEDVDSATLASRNPRSAARPPSTPAPRTMPEAPSVVSPADPGDDPTPADPGANPAPPDDPDADPMPPTDPNPAPVVGIGPPGAAIPGQCQALSLPSNPGSHCDGSRIVGDDDHDEIDATDCNDTVYGLRGIDFVRGLHGHDTLYGGRDNDTLFGGKGNDHLYGQNGHDQLHGGEGDDTYYLGVGNDVVDDMGGGHDTLVCEAGVSIESQYREGLHHIYQLRKAGDPILYEVKIFGHYREDCLGMIESIQCN